MFLGLGPIQSKRMFLGTFGLGPNSVRTARMRKTKVFGHIRAWAPFSPNSQNAENECFWAHSGLGPIQSEQPECGKRMFLGTFGLGPNSARTARMRKTNVFGHIRAWAPFSPSSQNAENECFWAHSGLGPIQSEEAECGKQMFLGTFGLAPNSVRTGNSRFPQNGNSRFPQNGNSRFPQNGNRRFPQNGNSRFTKRETPFPQNGNSRIPDFHKTGIPDFHKTGLPNFQKTGIPDFHKTGIPDFHKTGILDLHKTGIADFHKTGIPDSQNGNSPFPQNGNSRIPDFHKMGIPDFHKTGILDFHKTAIAAF